MKRFILAAGLLAALVSPRLQAQTVDMRAKVPFDFHVGNDRMPAGEYVFSHSHTGLLTISPATGARSIFALTNNDSGPTSPGASMLEFQRYGGVYFLKRFWINDGLQRSLRTSAYEREIAARLTPDNRAQTAQVSLKSK
jgi:hypothetical protein